MKKNIRKSEEKANAASLDAAQMEKVEALRRRVFEQKEAGNYDEALLAVIELFEMNYVEVELLYETADLYYLSGDYERAAIWGEKTLSFDSNHMRALLLLANVYAIEDKVKKGLATLQRILEVGAGNLTEEAKESVDEILDYFDSDYDVETLEEKYPLIWAYLQEGGGAAEADDAAEPVAEELADAEEALSISQEIEESVEVEVEAEVEEEPEVDEEPEAEVMRQVSEAAFVREAAEEAAAAAAERLQEAPSAQEPAARAVSVFSEQEETELLALSPEEVSQFIMGKELSLTEKLGLCNYFAAFYEERKRPEHVVALLRQALRIDCTDELSLKNLGYVLCLQGDREGAMQCFNSLRRKDLMVLAQIRKMQH